MEHLKMHSMNKVDENVSKIATLFPNCVTEAKDNNGEITHKIDFDMLKQELSNTLVEGREERYQFTWPEKKQAVLTANTPINKTLRPCRKESINFDKTHNLYIEGDNLEVLKLLQETYLGKIKMIYIDPPYNTGKDTFVYDDDFSTSLTDFGEAAGQYDENGNILYDIRNNDQSNGRFHTDWCNMIYPRLKLAKDLLSDDGVIFISIDDNEYDNLQKITDEIFGSENRLETFHIQVRYDNKSLNEKDDFQKLIEYVLIYAKSRKDFEPKKPTTDYDLTKFNLNIKELKKPDKHFTIKGREVDVFLPDSYKIEVVPDEETNTMNYFKETWVTGSIYSGTGHGLVYQQVVEPRDKEDGLGVLYKIYGLGEDGLGYRYMTGPKQASSKFGKMYNKIPLNKLEGLKAGTYKKSTPIINFYNYSPDFGNIRHEGGIAFNGGKKPVKMLKNFLGLIKSNDFICLDFFSGSASTAHAVMQLNSEDNGNRKFIMVQIPEPCDEKSEAAKDGFVNVCEVGKERIRRAGKKIKEEAGENGKNLDVGFRVLKCDSSNMEDVYYTPDHIDTNDLFKNNIKSDRTGEDLLFQTMLDLGIMLSSKIETKKINGKEVFCVEGNYLMACFDDSVDEKTITEIAKEKPYYFVMRDPANSKDGDSLITNFEQIFTTYSPDTVRKVL